MASQLNWTGGSLYGAMRFRLASEPFGASWFDPDNDLPRLECFRPDTRGREGAEPPPE